MASEPLKEYRKDMTLAVLARSLTPMTSGEIAENFLILAQAESHPDRCWRGVGAGSINGYLKQLQRAKLAAKDGEKRDGRAGRDVCLWSTPLEKSDAPIPYPPTDLDPVPREAPRAPATASAPAATSPSEQYSRGELSAMLEVHGELALITFRHMRELSEWTERARQRLAAAGLEVPGL